MKALIRKLKILIFLLSKKIYDDTKFFDYEALCQGCEELHNVYRYEVGKRVNIFYLLPVKFPWRLEICTYCYTVRKQEFVWGRDRVELNYSINLIRKKIKKNIFSVKKWKSFLSRSLLKMKF